LLKLLVTHLVTQKGKAMARNTKPISDTQIKKAKSKEKDYAFFDGGGLQLTVRKSGSKVFEFRYKSPVTQKYQKITIGKYPIVSLAKAREERLTLQKQRHNHIDPKLEKIAKDMTVKNVAEEFKIKIHKEIAPNTYKRNAGAIDRDIVRFLGHLNIKDLTRFHIIGLLKDVESRGLGYSVKLVHNLCTRILRYAVGMGYIEHNVSLDVDRDAIIARVKPKNFAHIIDTKQLQELMCKLKNSSITPPVKLGLMFAMHTFLRPFNIRYLEWKEIDFDKKIILIPVDKMKTRKPHIIPLSETSIKILQEAQKLNGSDKYVFLTLNKKVMSDATLNRALERLGYRHIQTSHGFRHTASTLLNENIQNHGVHTDAIERQLAHVEGGVKGVYNKAEYISERVKLMHWWSSFLSSLCTF